MNFRRHWPWLLLLIPILFGLVRLRLDVEVMNLLPDDFPVVRGLKLYQTNFSNARELIIVVEADDAQVAEDATRDIAVRLRAATNLVAEVAWQPLWLDRPGESAELISYLWFNQPPDEFGALTNRLAPSNLPTLVREAQEALTTSLSPQDLARRGYDPFELTELPEAVSGAAGFGESADMFSSADGTFRVVFAEASRDITSYRACKAWLKQVQALIASTVSADRNRSVTIRYTGRPAFVTEIASGMERDITVSVGGTMLIIAALFWWAHRRWLPLLWLLALLALILGATMALGGLVFGTLSVISMGFAAILLGLAVDYGMVLYQESQTDPHATANEVRRALWSSIVWSAVTTAGAFAILNLGGLPGLAQLGTLVAIGVVLAAGVMLLAYLPPLLKSRPARMETTRIYRGPSPAGRKRLAWTTTLVVLIVAGAALSWRAPRFDNSADALRPAKSPAYAAVEEIKHRLQRTQEPMWVLVAARDEAEMVGRLRIARAALERAMSNGLVASFTLSDTLWPNPSHQLANRDTAAALTALEPQLRRALLEGGFTTNSFALTENLLNTWRAASTATNVFWPTNESSRWVLEKFMARRPGQLLALGLIHRNTNATLAALITPLLALARELSPDQIYLSGWEMLGHSVFSFVQEHFPRVLAPMAVLLTLSLWLAFRRVHEMLVSVATLLVSGLLLVTVMAMANWSWNLMNLMALPLLLGAGVDYSIHMQVALRRHEGDLRALRRGVVRALLLCGGTTVTAFSSLSLSNNAGMASLGKVCATGIACCMFTAICLLPTWWRASRKH